MIIAWLLTVNESTRYYVGYGEERMSVHDMCGRMFTKEVTFQKGF
jgi:hypothetical protein